MRPAWAQTMSEIITQGGILIALQHPLDPSIFHADDPTLGPPWLLNPEMYSLPFLLGLYLLTYIPCVSLTYPLSLCIP